MGHFLTASQHHRKWLLLLYVQELLVIARAYSAICFLILNKTHEKNSRISDTILFRSTSFEHSRESTTTSFTVAAGTRRERLQGKGLLIFSGGVVAGYLVDTLKTMRLRYQRKRPCLVL
jgi:hypothetical protein